MRWSWGAVPGRALWAPLVAYGIRWEGPPDGEQGAALARALRSGSALVDLTWPGSSFQERNVVPEVLKLQSDTKDCEAGPTESVNVMDSLSSDWGQPPCWTGSKDLIQRLFTVLQSLASWSVIAAARHTENGRQWLGQAGLDLRQKQQLLRAMAYRPLPRAAHSNRPLGGTKGVQSLLQGWQRVTASAPGEDVFQLDLGEDFNCQTFDVTGFLVRGSGRFHVNGSLDGVSWRLLATGQLPASALPVVAQFPNLPVRHLRALAPAAAVLQPHGLCTGLRAPTGRAWSRAPPHQDASWITVLIESAPGLYAKPSRDRPWHHHDIGSTRALVLVGARLALASKGFYPAACHGVEVPAQLRLSWALFSPSNSCLYRGQSPTWTLDSCAFRWRPSLVPPNVSTCADSANVHTQVGGRSLADLTPPPFADVLIDAKFMRVEIKAPHAGEIKQVKWIHMDVHAFYPLGFFNNTQLCYGSSQQIRCIPLEGGPVMKTEPVEVRRSMNVSLFAWLEDELGGRVSYAETWIQTASPESVVPWRESILRESQLASRMDWPLVWNQLNLARGAEVGVWEGHFSFNALAKAPGITEYLLVDPWRHLDDWNKPSNRDDDTFVEVHHKAMARTKLSPFGAKISVLRGTSSEVHARVQEKSLDWVYIDGDHTLKGVVLDLLLWYPKVKPGGLICGDDYVDDLAGPPQHDTSFTPTQVKPAVLAFAQGVGATVFDLGMLQFGFIKPDA